MLSASEMARTDAAPVGRLDLDEPGRYRADGAGGRRPPVEGEGPMIRRTIGRAIVVAVVAALAVWLAIPTVALGSTGALSPGRLGFCGGDDWEPAIAADAGKHVYVLITHYAGDPACDPASAQNGSRIMIQVSKDGGRTFAAPRVVADAPGGTGYPSQADPAIAVDASTGAVYVAFLAYGVNGGHTDIFVAKSTDAGQTFPAASTVKANAKDCKNCDHEKVLASGGNVYVAFSQAQYHFVSLSTDGGRSYVQATVDSSFVVGFAEGGVLDATGNAWFAWGDCESSNCTGLPAVDYRVSRTLAGTTTTAFSPVLAQAPQAPGCPYVSCGFAYFGGQDAIAIDAAGTLYLAWQDGQSHSTKLSPPVVNLSRCSTDCLSGGGWSFVNRVDDKAASGCAGSACYALFPQVLGGAAGHVSVTWMDDRNDSIDGTVDHVDGWNLWYRTSTDGGTTWTSAGQRISAYDPSQSQSGPNGFLFPYGDYTGLTLNPSCRNQAAMVWGEGHDWVGGATAPGHIEYGAFC